MAIGLGPALLLLVGLTAGNHVDSLAAFAVGLLIVGGAILVAMRVPEVRQRALEASPVREPALQHDLLEPLPDPVLVLNQRREALAANRAARDLFGIGAPGRDLAQSIRHPAVLAAVETLTSGIPSLVDEIDLAVPVPRTFTLHAARLPDAGNPEAPTIVVTFHDETRAKRAEQSRADFVANASHELRSPLSALIGFIETLRGPARDDAEARGRFLETMRSEALRMARLVDDLLSLSRVEINEHVPPRETLDVAQVLEDVASALTTRAEAKQMEILLDLPDTLPTVVGDDDQLNQVFHNLVDNAIKYGRPGTPVRISAERLETLPSTRGPGVAITVADEGDGIPAVHLPRITERFYRVDQGRARKLGGTGLGLAIVKHIVIRHRGQLRITSREGQGSAFTVQLPAAAIVESGSGAVSGGETARLS